MLHNNMVSITLFCVIVFGISISDPTYRVYGEPPTKHFRPMKDHSCPDNCTSCNQTYCFNCKTGYKGEKCELLCSNCEPKTACDKSSGFCFSLCRDGITGESCNERCDSKCLSCDRLNKIRCISCAYGRYGIFCNGLCSKGCLHNSCNSSDGVCSFGCSVAYWGHYCQEECANCKDDICDNTTGQCLNGCADGYSGINCSRSANENNFQVGGYSKLTASSIGLIFGQGLVVLACLTFVTATICVKRHRLSFFLRCSDWESDTLRRSL